MGIRAGYHSDVPDRLCPLLKTCQVNLERPGGNASATSLEDATRLGMQGRGHAEAPPGGLQSPQLQGAGAALIRALNGQLGITLCPPPCGPRHHNERLHHGLPLPQAACPQLRHPYGYKDSVEHGAMANSRP
jgi:hypothetical protein